MIFVYLFGEGKLFVLALLEGKLWHRRIWEACEEREPVEDSERNLNGIGTDHQPNVLLGFPNADAETKPIDLDCQK